MIPNPNLDTRRASDGPSRTGLLLRRSFLLVGGLILLGGVIAVWQINVMRQRAQRLYQVEQPAMAVLVAHSDFEKFQEDLQLLASERDARAYTEKAQTLRRSFNGDIDRAKRAIALLRAGPERDKQLSELEAIRTSFSSHIDALIDLARLGDWEGVQLRTQNRGAVVNTLSEVLVRDIDELVAEQKREELDQIEQAGLRAMLTLLSIGLATLFIAAVLGWRVTQTIAGRLEQLDGAARALGRGEFHHRVRVGGSDEIGRLARVFNDMSAQLSDLYESLRRSEAQFRSLIENVSDFILVVDADGTIKYASPSFEREAGGNAPMAGKNLFDLAAEEDRGAVKDVVADVKNNNSQALIPTAETQFQIRRSDGQLRRLEVRATNLMKHPAVNGIVVNARDVTERRKLEEQLARAQRMEAIGTLSGGIAHDFNNILTVILGYTEVLEESMQSSDVRYTHLQRIDEAGRRASALTRQLLAFSRRQILQPKVFSLNSLIVDLDQMLRRIIREDIEFRTVTAPDLGSTRADPVQIEQVIMNLVVNARDAMPNGGRLTIETANVSLDGDYARTHEGASHGEHVMLAVSDTGVGIKAEILPHIFEPFFTTKEVGKGTGLGLSTVYGIVQQSGGHISVTSEPGHGTTFKIYFPRVNETPQVAIAAPKAKATTGSETVLLVEDEPALRDLIKEVLVANGFSIMEAASPAEAITLSKTHAGPVHLLLTDVVMPGMNGRELSEQVQQLRPEVKVLYMSGYATDFVTHDGKVDPGTNLLEKPFHAHSLLQRVREVLDGNTQPTLHPQA